MNEVTENVDPRLGSLYKQGSRYIFRERDGSWGVAARTLPILLLRLRGEKWSLGRIFRLGKDGPVPAPSGEIVVAAEEAGVFDDD